MVYAEVHAIKRYLVHEMFSNSICTMLRKSVHTLFVARECHEQLLFLMRSGSAFLSSFAVQPFSTEIRQLKKNKL